jgi:uncharacterized protein YcbK (DUF882 family)
MMEAVDLQKRRFVRLSLQVGLLSILPGTLQAALRHSVMPTPRKLAFYNIHTKEFLETCYHDGVDYLQGGLARINYLLRDHRTGDVVPIDTKLLDTLYHIHSNIDGCGTFSVISGYRCPATNAMLRRTTTGVAKNSYHMKGKAIDIRLKGCPTHKLHEVCIQARAGGVGYYPKSNFVHVDVGPIRCW